MKQRLKQISTNVLLLLALFFAACTAEEDNIDPNQKATVQVALRTTRANTGDYLGDAEECELIKWYRVVITQANQKQILLTIDKTLPSAKESEPLEEIVLDAGRYDIYAFANVDLDYLSSIGIKEGGTVPQNIQSLRYNIPTYFNAVPDADGHLEGNLVPVTSFAAAGGYIPMTGLAPQTVEVTSRVNQTFNIEVRRLFAKLEFQFSNPSETDLQVNAISVTDMTTNSESGSILLMNYEEGRNQLNLPYTQKKATLTHSFAAPCTLDSKGDMVSHSFYVLESQADKVSNSFNLGFSVTQKGEAATGSEENYMRYALTDPNTLTFIHRNDWIVIPITLADWQLRLEARTYPPIGGYPEADIDEDESHEFVVKFQGGGDFSIRPFIRKVTEGDNWFGIDNTARISGTPTLTVDDTNGIFQIAPTITNTGEIRGKMYIAPGKKACITLTVKVITNDSPLVTKTLTRKIFVTQN